MTNKHMKTCSISYVIREIQIKTTRYHYTPIRMTEIQNTDNTKCWQGCKATGTLFPGENAKCTAILEESLVIPYKTKYTPVIRSSSCLPWYFSPDDENLGPHKNRHTDVYNSSIHNWQSLETTMMSFSNSMDKQTVLHPDNGILSSAKKKLASKPWKYMKET